MKKISYIIICKENFDLPKKKGSKSMKLPWEKKHFCWAIILFLTIAASVLFFMILQKWEIVWDVVSLIFASLEPVTFGLIIAYLLNPLMMFVESKLVTPSMKLIFKKKYKEMHKISRGVSIIITWAIVCLMILALLSMVRPEIITSIEMLVGKMPEYASHVILWFENIMEENPQIFEFMENTVSIFAANFTDAINKILGAAPTLDVVFTEISNGVYAVVKSVLNLFVGIIVSVYVLKDKEKFVAQSKKLIYSMLPVKKANGVVSVFRLTHEKFGNFIIGKIFDSIIIGILCFIILSVFDIPYSVLVSVVVGVTNVIPFFGPFIGAIPSALLILCVDPIKCLTFIVIILLLQQFDGNILGPKILGSTTGVSSFWVLTSILVGSSLFGVWGMVCSVPLFAVIYTIISKYCKKTLKKRGMDYSTETFERIDHMDEESKAPIWVSEE